MKNPSQKPKTKYQPRCNITCRVLFCLFSFFISILLFNTKETMAYFLLPFWVPVNSPLALNLHPPEEKGNYYWFAKDSVKGKRSKTVKYVVK